MSHQPVDPKRRPLDTASTRSMHGTRFPKARRVLVTVIVVLTCLLPMASAWAQQASGIAGVVRDTSGGGAAHSVWRPADVLGGQLTF